MDLKQLLKKKVIRNEGLYKIFSDGVGSGPLDGGCVAMAMALKEVLGSGEVYVIESSTKHSKVFQAQHAVLKVGDLYADADGLSTKEKLLKSWIEEEDLVDPSLRRFRDHDLLESPRPKKLIDKIVAYIKGPGYVESRIVAYIKGERVEGTMSKAKVVKKLIDEQLHDFDQALTSFLHDSQKKVDAQKNEIETVTLEKAVGPKYIKIVHAIKHNNSGKVVSRSAWAFVDKETGDVFKPASWKAPAKHARANIFKPNTWSSVSAYGPAYLR